MSTPGTLERALVERDDELAALAGFVEQAVAGRGTIVHLIGESGAGKSALVAETVALAADRGLRVLAASAGELETPSPYAVARRLFDRVVAALDPEQRETVVGGPARLAADHLLGADRAPVEQSDLLNSLSWLLDGIARLGPALVVVDDAQWADEESLLFLASLRERLADLSVLVVLATREVAAQDRTPALAALVANRDATVLRIGSLSAAGVAEVLGRRWGSPVEVAVGSAATEVTGGNPFLVVALARLLADDDARSVERVRAAVPTSVVDAVVARLAALPDADRALVRAVAVLDHAPTRLAAELAGLDDTSATAAADRLRAAGLLADAPDLGFRHALLRSAVTSTTPPGERERLHRAAARLIDDQDRAAAHLLAVTGTGDPWAVRTLREAAAAAADAGAPQSAVRLLRRAVAEPPDDAARPGLMLDLGLAEMRNYDPACVESLQAAEAQLDDPADRARCSLALADAFNFAGFHELAADGLAGTLAAVEAADDAEFVLTVEAALIASSLLVPERIAAARERLAARPDLAGTTPGERAFLLQQLANAAGTNQPADVIRGLAARAFSDTDVPESTDWAWARLFLSAVGDFDVVRRHTDDGFAKAAERGSVLGFVSASFVRAFTEYAAGSLFDAEVHYRAMLDHADALAHGTLVALLGNAGLAQTLGMQGRLPEAVEILAAFPEELPADAPVNGVAAMTFARAVVRELLGEHESALAAAEEAGRRLVELDVDSPTWAVWRALAIRPLRGLGRVDDARALALEHLALCEASEVPHHIAEALVLLRVDQDRRDPPLPHLPQARHPGPRRPPRGPHDGALAAG